ncbi:MAG: hypothetical protein AB7F86_05165 [Bdellovibrionales bacterium]
MRTFHRLNLLKIISASAILASVWPALSYAETEQPPRHCFTCTDGPQRSGLMRIHDLQEILEKSEHQNGRSPNAKEENVREKSVRNQKIRKGNKS